MHGKHSAYPAIVFRGAAGFTLHVDVHALCIACCILTHIVMVQKQELPGQFGIVGRITVVYTPRKVLPENNMHVPC